MAKYIYLYRGPATPIEDFTPEQGAEQMEAWNAWAGKAGKALIDFGSPFGPRTAVVDDGTEGTASEQNGYTIVEAASLDEARTLPARAPVPGRGQGPVRDRRLRAHADVTKRPTTSVEAGYRPDGGTGTPGHTSGGTDMRRHLRAALTTITATTALLVIATAAPAQAVWAPPSTGQLVDAGGVPNGCTVSVSVAKSLLAGNEQQGMGVLITITPTCPASANVHRLVDALTVQTVAADGDADDDELGPDRDAAEQRRPDRGQLPGPVVHPVREPRREGHAHVPGRGQGDRQGPARLA